MRLPTTPSRHRWSRRQARAGVASVVAAAPVTHRRPVPGAHLAASDKGRQLMFDDIDEILDGPAAMPERWVPARSADQLDHASVMATIAAMRAEPLPTFEQAAADTAPVAPDAMRKAFDSRTWLPASIGLCPVPLVGIDEQVDEILATVAAAPFVRHEDALAMVLAPLAEMLAEVAA